MRENDDGRNVEARLTAYVLGELDPDERSRVEAELATSSHAAREVAAIRATARELEAALSAEPAEGLRAQQRVAILGGWQERGEAQRPVVRRIRWPLVAAAMAAAAASVVAVIHFGSSETHPFTYDLGGDGDAFGLEGLGYLGDDGSSATALVAPLDKETRERLESLGYVEGESSRPSDSRVEYGRWRKAFDALGGTGSSQPAPREVAAPDKIVVGRIGSLPGISVIDQNGFGAGTARQPALSAADPDSFGVFHLGANTEAYASVRENEFRAVAEHPLSTFSIDVDTASYANVRRFLSEGRLPPPDAVRIEELLNYFRYDYPEPSGGDPFSISLEVASAPWRPEHRLVRIGLKGRAISFADRKPSNLVFLIDVSGSMSSPDKLQLALRGMRLLVDQLDERDSVAIVVYAGAAGLVLEPTSGANRPAILGALERLSAGGSTNGSGGIALAYQTARANFADGGVNRVILCTDGDFNVGTTSEGELVRLIEEQAKSGVFLSVLGFGRGNLKDSTMEKLADRGNGNYAYVDSLREAQKVLVEQMGGTLVTIAKDVKIQVEFNPLEVGAYRLIGYENRVLAAEDFDDDAVDAGEIGADHCVTALYEIVPLGVASPARGVAPLEYQDGATRPSAVAGHGELLTVKLRYKEPDGEVSRLLEQPLVDAGTSIDQASADLRFAAAVAGFGMRLRESQHAGAFLLRDVHRFAREATGSDRGGYRAEFLELVTRAWKLSSADGREDLGYLGYVDSVGYVGDE